MNRIPLKKNKINPSERVNNMILGFEQVKWVEVAEWLEYDDIEGLYYTFKNDMFPMKLTKLTRLRVSELASYKWYLKKNQ